ncbi:hypothetical protein SBOR_7853 [Sclerotinia borealis F-4128]|uniref:Uncharacterized protein n=1 Tax=Sclerotinia borealis (strain F-4128) TaxID=1432307 RepID=W9C7B4_SCLBF|nr:hypothetical protein SBOR_7853 [Sclerotinia borealis F-4128]
MSDASNKLWYRRQLQRLHEEAPEGEKTTPEEALRHLPIECIGEVLDVVSRKFVECGERYLIEGNKGKCDEFIRAHLDVCERYNNLNSQYYQDIARIAGMYWVRKAMANGEPKYTCVYVDVPQIPASPLSGTRTLCSIDSWMDDVKDGTPEPPSERARSEQPSTETSRLSALTCEDGLPEQPCTCKAKDNSQRSPPKNLSSKQTTVEKGSKRKKIVKKKTIPARAIKEGTKHRLRGTKEQRPSDVVISSDDSGVKETIPAKIEKNTNYWLRGTKRQRPSDIVLSSDDSGVNETVPVYLRRSKRIQIIG